MASAPAVRQSDDLLLVQIRFLEGGTFEAMSFHQFVKIGQSLVLIGIQYRRYDVNSSGADDPADNLARLAISILRIFFIG